MAIEETKLIENVRAHECLYNVMIPEYKNFHAKLAAWRQISSNLNIPVPECKSKWNHLRNAFLHALSRRKSSGQPLKKFKKWKYEDVMKFLVPFMALSIRDSVLNTENEDHSNDYSESQDEEYSNGGHTLEINKKRKIEYQEELSQEIGDKRQFVEVEETENINIFGTPLTYNTQKLNPQAEILQLLKQKVERKKDEIDLLFESLAKAVKQLPKSEQINVKAGVTKLVYEAQMRCESQ